MLHGLRVTSDESEQFMLFSNRTVSISSFVHESTSILWHQQHQRHTYILGMCRNSNPVYGSVW